MHALVATDGQLDATATADFAACLAGPGGRVTVLTVVEVPRAFLDDMRADWGAPQGSGRLVDDAYVVTPAVPREAPQGWPGDDALIDRYLNDKKVQYTAPIVDILRNSDIHADARVVESENVSLTIINQCAELGADVVIIGTHGRGLVQGLLGSNGTKIVRRSPIPVLLIRTTSS